MARAQRARKAIDEYSGPSITRPMNLDDQEDQLITLAVDLAMKRLKEGTASNQLVAEIIQMGTTQERLAREKLQRENDMLRVKTEAIEASKRNGDLYADALKAFRQYSGHIDFVDEDEYEEDY